MAGQLQMQHIQTKINEDETYAKDKRVSEQIPLKFTSNKFDSGDAHIVTPHDIHDLLLSGLKVPVKRTLLAVAGLPGCNKSKSLMRMLNKVVTECNEAMAPLSFLNTGNGMPYCELAAAGSLQTQPKYSEATRNTCYLYAMEFCINEHYRHQIGKFDNSASEVKFFKDNDLDLHFRHILQCLNKNHESPSSTHTWQAIPNGLAEINIWDINRSKSIYHFLPALWGHLDRSYLWLFLDLDHDKSKLHQLPSVPENGDLIMRYHTNLYYFLRYTMLVKSRIQDRENVCSLFAMNESGNLDGIYSIEGHIKEAAMQMGVKALIKEPITPLQQRVNDVELLSGKLDSLANETLNSSQKIPLSFVFLRSLFYDHERIYITKSELQLMGCDLKMTELDLKKFCKFFMSSGSFIDVSQIDSTSPYVIVKPMRFLRELDKIFCDSDSHITGYGLVIEEKAKAIFGQEYQFFMDVLVSVDLAIKLKGNRIDFEGTPPLSPDHTYYYMPDVRVEPPDLTCHPSALNLLLDISCPLSHLQVVFAKAYFANVSQQSSLLVLNKNTPINITSFRTKSVNSSEEINFQLRYLGNVIEIHLPKVDLLADEAFCTDVVRACNKMMIDKWVQTKYAFTVTCSGHESANYFHCVRHILPQDGQCKRCKENDSLKLWNKVIVMNEVPKFRQLKKGTPIRLTSSENLMFQEKLEKLQSELDDTKEQKELLVAEVKSLESQLRQELQEANDETMKENRDHNTHEKGEEEVEPNPNVTENGKMKILREELQDSQTLLMIEKKASSAQSQELDYSRKQITDLKEKRKLTSTLSSDEETMEVYYEKTLEREPLEEKKSKPVDEDKPKSDISDSAIISWLVHLCVLLIAIVVGLFSDHSMSSIYPDGMQVVGERRFIVTGDNSAFTLDWVQFGLRIEIPKGSLPAGSTTGLHVKAIIGGDFVLPPDCYLVSGIYQISSSEQFKKNITLHLPHAAIIKSEEASYFRFYTADCSSGPPYEFKEMEGGYFRPHSNSATIDVHHFSCYTIGATTICPNQRYLSHVFYKSISNSVKKWKMVFTVTKDVDIFVEHVKQMYHDHHLEEYFLVQLQENAKYLQIIPETYSISSWKVYKAVSSQIERTVIESYHPKNNSYIPHYTYKFIWQSDSSPSDVNLEFMLVGADSEFGFSVLLPPEAIEPIENKETDNVIKSTIDDKTGGLIPSDEDLLVHLRGEAQVKSFCVHLKLTLDDCDQIATANQNLGDQKIAILKKWKQVKERTWKEFILPFALLGNCVKAKELAIEYCVYFEEDLKDDKKVLDICEYINNHD